MPVQIATNFLKIWPSFERATLHLGFHCGALKLPVSLVVVVLHLLGNDFNESQAGALIWLSACEIVGNFSPCVAEIGKGDVSINQLGQHRRIGRCVRDGGLKLAKHFCRLFQVVLDSFFAPRLVGFRLSGLGLWLAVNKGKSLEGIHGDRKFPVVLLWHPLPRFERAKCGAQGWRDFGDDHFVYRVVFGLPRAIGKSRALPASGAVVLEKQHAARLLTLRAKEGAGLPAGRCDFGGEAEPQAGRLIECESPRRLDGRALVAVMA